MICGWFIVEGSSKELPKTPYPPLATERRCLMVRGGFALSPWFAATPRELRTVRKHKASRRRLQNEN
ncbi:hypothetical protein AVEN_23696-1 [Araneus ventricosus]|uniref:Uncharacterized protein n=1 Tax=Araneus ventricosus TaxID=182803 RepID=A0A4Y2X532_ARAVE|nr:hypothetical protein AVEN_23696-1 [Araneus ventricosus]